MPLALFRDWNALDNDVSLQATPATVHATFAARVESHPGAPFLHTGGEEISFAEISAAVDSMARAWLQMGLVHGDRIAIAAANSREWLVTYLSAAKIGAVLVPLNVVYRDREFIHMLNQSGTRVLVCDAAAGDFEFGPFLARISAEVPGVERFVFICSGEERSVGATGGSPTGPPGSVRWEELESSGPADRLEAPAAVEPHHPLAIIYTSGTTGTPKGAVMTHGSALASAAGQVRTFNQDSDDVILGTMPWNHVGGITATLGTCLLTGGSVALLPRFHPELVAAAVAQAGVTMMVGVPTMYKMMLGSEAFQDLDVASVRLCVAGGSNVEPALAHAIAGRFPGVRLANLYGLSETSGACIISPVQDSLDTVSTTIGTALSGFEARIVDDLGSPLPTGVTGELQVRGGGIAGGYWDMPGATEATFTRGGWLFTGDICSMSDDGHVTLLGRKKEMYVRGGYNVYPAEIENVLGAHPTVAMCAVIGIPDPVFGETGCAFVVPAPGETVDPEALREMCRSTLAEYKVPDRVEIVDSLPMTPAGKIRKVELAVPAPAPSLTEPRRD